MLSSWKILTSFLQLLDRLCTKTFFGSKKSKTLLPNPKMSNELSPDHPRYQGLRAFSQLILHSLTTNKRSKDDPAHVTRLESMCDSNNTEPVCDKLIEYLYNQQISDQDFNTSTYWYTAPLAVTTNFEGHSALIVLYARVLVKPTEFD